MANNASVRVAGAMGWHALFRAEPHWAGFAALHQPLVMLLLLAIMVTVAGRLYCNTLCPVGTLLGWLAQRAAFRLEINPTACQKCGDCLKVCKAHCIDLRAQTIDFSRCVACYNCIGTCDRHAVQYRYGWKPAAGIPENVVANAERRAFVSQAILGTVGVSAITRLGPGSSIVCPPGSGGVEEFIERCTACHLCVSECPTGVLQPTFLEYGFAGLMKPRLAYPAAFCNYDCRRCGEVCPDGAIKLLDLAEKHLTKIGEATFHRDKCVVVTNGTDCAACSENCPTKAVTTIPYGDNLRLPSLNADLCIGCGGCQYACPVQPDKAITVAGLRRHKLAKQFIEPRATLPKTSGDFPF
jgi:ferredoxin